MASILAFLTVILISTLWIIASRPSNVIVPPRKFRSTHIPNLTCLVTHSSPETTQYHFQLSPTHSPTHECETRYFLMNWEPIEDCQPNP